MEPKKISAEEFDRLFDEGSDEVDQYIDWSSARRINETPKRVNIDFPQWMVAGLDRDARLRGISRQALIKLLVFEFLGKKSGVTERAWPNSGSKPRD